MLQTVDEMRHGQFIILSDPLQVITLDVNGGGIRYVYFLEGKYPLILKAAMVFLFGDTVFLILFHLFLSFTWRKCLRPLSSFGHVLYPNLVLASLNSWRKCRKSWALSWLNISS